MEPAGSSNSETAAAFRSRLHGGHPGPLLVSWDNAPAHRGEALRECRRTPGLELGLVNLPGYSPDCNADAAIGVWAGQEATGNQRRGTRALVRERASAPGWSVGRITPNPPKVARVTATRSWEAWVAGSRALIPTDWYGC